MARVAGKKETLAKGKGNQRAAEQRLRDILTVRSRDPPKRPLSTPCRGARDAGALVASMSARRRFVVHPLLALPPLAKWAAPYRSLPVVAARTVAAAAGEPLIRP